MWSIIPRKHWRKTWVSAFSSVQFKAFTMSLLLGFLAGNKAAFFIFKALWKTFFGEGLSSTFFFVLFVCPPPYLACAVAYFTTPWTLLSQCCLLPHPLLLWMPSQFPPVSLPSLSRPLLLPLGQLWLGASPPARRASRLGLGTKSDLPAAGSWWGKNLSPLLQEALVSNR